METSKKDHIELTHSMWRGAATASCSKICARDSFLLYTVDFTMDIAQKTPFVPSLGDCTQHENVFCALKNPGTIYSLSGSVRVTHKEPFESGPLGDI